MSQQGGKLNQIQSQRLLQRLNPQNVALGRILEMSTPEFEDEVRRQLDDNPAIELVDDSFEETEDVSVRERKEFYPTESSHRDPTSWAADEEGSLYESLMQRLTAEHELSPEQLRIAAYIIGNLDTNGYLTRGTEAIADDLAVAEGMSVSIKEVRDVLAAVRSLDPAGIAAFDLRDCLLLQLDRRTPSPVVSTAREIIADYFDLFSKMHYERLQSSLNVSHEELKAALDLIRTLNPKPASSLEVGLSSDRSRHVVPDFNLEIDDDPELLTVRLVSGTPNLALEPSFDVDLKASAPTAREREALSFIKKKREEALNFMNLVELRSMTLLAIMQSILFRQRAFFYSGEKSDIRPMILKDIAEDTGFDLSVISRAAQGKYISTPHGIYPLKLLFNERPDVDSDVSSHEILDALSKMIEAEDKSHPLSDRELTDALVAKGYDIARRTVAKYRERLGLPVARLRKTY